MPLFGKKKKDEESSRRQEELKKNVKLTEHQEDLDKLIGRLETDTEKGLTSKAAEERNRTYGDNKLTPPPTTPKWMKFLEEMLGFFSLLLWAGAVLCFIAYALRKEVDNMYLGIVLAVVVFVTGCFSFYQNNKADNLMNSFAKLLPPDVMCLRDGKLNSINSEKLVKGDIIQLEAGNLVPADIRVLQCSDNMVVDNASLTGEPEPLKRKDHPTNSNPLETANLCFFGTNVPEGSCKGVIINIGDNTVMGRIAKLTLETENEDTPINKEIKHFIHIITAIAMALGITFFIIGFIINPEPIDNLVFLISIIVANVPEGLLATVTVCLTLTAKRMHGKQVLVKNLEGVETLGSTSCICSDKTGTLTQNVMTVAQIVYGNSDKVHTQDAGSSLTRGNITYDVTNKAFMALRRCAILNNTAAFLPDSKVDKQGNAIPFKEEIDQGGNKVEIVNWRLAGNASEQAFLKFAQGQPQFDVSGEKLGDIDVEEFQKDYETVFTIPFNSTNKYQVHIHKQKEYNNADGSENVGPRVVLMKGAPERIITRCSKVNLNGNVVAMDEDMRNDIVEQQVELSRNGLRVLGFAELELPVETYPPDYEYNDGKEAGYSTPNFPLGEFANEEARKQDADETGEPHPNSLEGLTFIGLMALIDPPRPAVPGAVDKCKTAGIKVIMVTGDHPITAQAIAHKVGILWSNTRGEIEAENKRFQKNPGDDGWVDPDTAKAIVVAGHTISVDMGQDKWDDILSYPQIVFARTSPQQKLVIVEKNQQKGEIVAVTGDGVNDSPALKKADIGVAMGIMGSEVSKNAADMILLDDNFASIVAGVEEGRLIFDNLKKSICYTLTSNIPEISPFLCYIVIGTPLPLSTVLILGIDLGTDMIPAISMAYEEAEADIMKRPPRNAKTDRLVTKKLIVFAYLQIGMMQAAAGFYTWMVVLNDYGFPPHILQGLGYGDFWGYQPLYCKFSGGQYVSVDGDVALDLDPTIDAPTREYPLWDVGDHGNIDNCEYPLRNLKGGKGTPSGFDYTDASTYDSSSTGDSSAAVPQITLESILGMESNYYFEYIPWRGRQSPFWKDSWLYWDITESETTGGGLGNAEPLIYFKHQNTGLWSLCAADSDLSEKAGTDFEGTSNSWDLYDTPLDVQNAGCDAAVYMTKNLYTDAKFCNAKNSDSDCDIADANVHQISWCDTCSEDCVINRSNVNSGGTSGCMNIASRMIQKEALHHAQGSYFVSIVVVQWADLLICKTRWLSLREQGMRNSTMNFALFFETLLAAWLAYCPPINTALGTRNMRFTHWFPAIPFSMAIFMYDEVRKYLMRTTSPEMVDKGTGQVTRRKGWLEINTYY